MTNRFMKAALAGTVLATALVSTSAQAATATAFARAQILRQVTVTQVLGADLDFATIVTGAAASTVVVSPGGARTCGAGLVCTGTTAAAAFTIQGTTGAVVTIAADPTVSLTSGVNSMSATLLTSAATRTLTGTDGFTVGGTLSVGANQADGAYNGTFTVTVNYQ